MVKTAGRRGRRGEWRCGGVEEAMLTAGPHTQQLSGRVDAERGSRSDKPTCPAAQHKSNSRGITLALPCCPESPVSPASCSSRTTRWGCAVRDISVQAPFRPCSDSVPQIRVRAQRHLTLFRCFPIAACVLAFGRYYVMLCHEFFYNDWLERYSRNETL